MFEELTTQEIALVSGGDRWAGTPEGRMTCMASSLAMSVLLTGGTGAAGTVGAAGAAGGAPGPVPVAGPSRWAKVPFLSR